MVAIPILRCRYDVGTVDLGKKSTGQSAPRAAGAQEHNAPLQGVWIKRPADRPPNLPNIGSVAATLGSPELRF